MKILHLIPALSSGGAEKQLSYLAPKLVARGHEVHIGYLNEGHYKPDMPGVILHKLNIISNYSPLLLWKLQTLVHRIKPDIIHTWILQMDIAGGIVAQLNKIPWVFREPSSAMAYPSTWKNRLRVWIASGARAIVSNSSGGDDYWEKLIPRSRRTVIINGLPLEKIKMADVGLVKALQDINQPVVLYVGRLSSDRTASKNLKNFLHVLVYVKKKKDVFGVLCGEGPQQEELKDLAQALSLERNIYFTGYLTDVAVWSLMKRADVFVSLSAYEGCPNAAMEAAAIGCPLVLSDIPSHRELFDETSASFVDPIKIDKTAYKIIQVLSHVEVSQKKVLEAQQKSREWSLALMAQKYESLYEDML